MQRAVAACRQGRIELERPHREPLQVGHFLADRQEHLLHLVEFPLADVQQDSALCFALAEYRQLGRLAPLVAMEDDAISEGLLVGACRPFVDERLVRFMTFLWGSSS